MSTYSQKDMGPLSDWISQAEAARLRGCTRQAVAKLVRNGRLRTIEVAGYTLVSREEIMKFRAHPSGRPKSQKRK